MNAIDIVKEQAAAYDAGKSYAVVTIVHSDGSTPRSSGKMIVYADGTTRGTIGGGAVEIGRYDVLRPIADGRERHEDDGGEGEPCACAEKAGCHPPSTSGHLAFSKASGGAGAMRAGG